MHLIKLFVIFDSYLFQPFSQDIFNTVLKNLLDQFVISLDTFFKDLFVSLGNLLAP